MSSEHFKSENIVFLETIVNSISMSLFRAEVD